MERTDGPCRDRSPSSVGRLDLAADLAARKVARSRVRGRDAIVRVDIHIGGSTGHVLEQVAHRVPRRGPTKFAALKSPSARTPLKRPPPGAAGGGPPKGI